MITKNELVKFAESKIGTPYIYGMRGEVATKDKIDALSLYYPNVFNDNYRKRCYNYIGKVCVDCSGLISWATGIQRSSQGFYDTATEKIKYYKGMNLKNYIGWGLWRSGHVGIVTGNNECIEARGIDYGTVKSIVSNRNFEYIIKLKDVDYNNNKKGNKDNPYIDRYGDITYENIGWHIDDMGVWYRYKEGSGKNTYYSGDNKNLDGDCFEIEGLKYLFNSDGYVYGIIRDKKTIKGVWDIL